MSNRFPSDGCLITFMILILVAVWFVALLWLLTGCSGLYHDPGRGGIEWDRKANPRDYPLYDIAD